MNKEIVFHLGDHKTGSTSIQAALRADAIRAPRKIGYPTNKLHHVPLARAILDHPGDKQESNRFNALLEHMAGSDAEIEVVSAEKFEGLDGFQVRAALERHMPDWLPRARFIAYVRPHADRLVSSWAEQLKLGLFRDTLEAFFTRTNQNQRYVYIDRFQSWRDAFGDAFELRPMIRDHLYKRDVVEDFISYAVRGTDFTITGEVAANESLSLEDLSVLRMIHNKLDAAYDDLKLGTKDRNAEAAIARNLAINLSERIRAGGTKPALHKGLVARVQESYAEDAAALDAAFFDGTPMTDALNDIAAKAVDTPQKPFIELLLDPTEQRMAEAMGDFICRMALMAPHEWGSFFANERTGRVQDTLMEGEVFQTRGVRREAREVEEIVKTRLAEELEAHAEKLLELEETAQTQVEKKLERAEAKIERLQRRLGRQGAGGGDAEGKGGKGGKGRKKGAGGKGGRGRRKNAEASEA